jgi:DNA-binding NarL/FixJ family response regulator
MKPYGTLCLGAGAARPAVETATEETVCMSQATPRDPEKPRSRTTVLLVDDHRMFLEGLRRILEGQGDLEVVGETDTVAGALEQARLLNPRVVLLDLGLKDGSGLDALPKLREACPAAAIVVLSGYGSENVLPALRQGARGFVSKDTASVDLLKAIRAVLRGEIWAEPQATGRLVTELSQRPSQWQRHANLTPREHEVLRLVGEGKRNHEIARQLFITENTVKTHISSVMRKLGIEDRIQLALHAARFTSEIG